MGEGVTGCTSDRSVSEIDAGMGPDGVEMIELSRLEHLRVNDGVLRGLTDEKDCSLGERIT